MPYVVDVTLLLRAEDLPPVRLAETFATVEEADAAGRDAVARYGERGIGADYTVSEVAEDTDV